MKPRDWAWAALGAVVAICVVAAGLLVGWTSSGNENNRIEENRVIGLSRALAYVAANRPASDVNRYIETLRGQLGDRLIEAYYLDTGEVDRFGLSTGNRYLANLDPTLVNTDPRRSESDRQKQIFDRAESVMGAATPYLVLLVTSFNLERIAAAPYFNIVQEQTEDGRSYINVNVPVVRPDASLHGVAGISLVNLSPGATLPWGQVILIGLLALAVLMLLGLFRPRFRWMPIVMGLAMVALMAIVSLWMMSWERSAYTTKVELLAAEQNVLMQSAVVLSDWQVIGYALRDYRDNRTTDLSGLPFTAAGAIRDNSTPFALALTFLFLGLALVGLHGFLVRTFRHLVKSPWAYIYVFPSMIGMLVLVFGPFLFGVALAFHERDAGRFVFVGLSHFVKILSGERTAAVTFYWTLFVTLFWTAANVVIHVVSGLILALILNDQMLRFKKFYRVILILPWAIPNYITALIWRGLFDHNDGAVNQALALIGLGKIDWLGGSFFSAFSANLITNCWLGFPFMMVVSLGALQSIPADLYEAAEVDGATRWQMFKRITLPLLKPALFPAVILGSIWTFNMFNIIYLVSGGGPNSSTEILITQAYKAFYVLGRWGYAAAYSVIIFLILLVFSSIMNRVSKATEGAFE
ncbi:MAG: sugar ABC transporter permease [Bradymonadales bacterium]|nr:sugar ABC transporter permease [Bradymonadales bacterium]